MKTFQHPEMQRAYDLGYQACMNLEDMESNPFEPLLAEHDIWNEGFLCADDRLDEATMEYSFDIHL